MNAAKLDPEERRRRVNIIVEGCGGINPMYLAFYGEALDYAATAACDAFARFDAACVAGDLQDHADEIVASVHEALTHGAALSRFLWPAANTGIPPRRAAQLRKLLEMDETSSLYDRALRNALEHFDERLDEFLLGDIVGYVFPGPMVGPAELAEDEFGKIFRMVDPETQTFVLFGEKYSFSRIRAEIIRLKNNLGTLR